MSDHTGPVTGTIRRAPISSLVIAIALGVILKTIPLGQILLVVARTALALLKPALLMFGLVQILSLLGRTSRTISNVH